MGKLLYFSLMGMLFAGFLRFLEAETGEGNNKRRFHSLNVRGAVLNSIR